ncbi:MAG: PASTA domain-containing protein [Candidatus Edwardsbacteria bacterium]|jgi:hypothetical protein|nr:PASTA domain-containing protein [Candidatus Edwardsbacteria bacterium]
MTAIHWIEAALGLLLCCGGLYLTVFRRGGAGVRLEAGVLKLAVSNAGAFLLLLGAALLLLARISAVAWKDVEIQLNEARADSAALAARADGLQRRLDDAAAQLAAVAAAGTAGERGYRVPDVTGLPLDRAVALIRRNSLDTLAVRWVAPPDSVPGAALPGPGSVVAQGVLPGVALPRRSRVLVTAVRME